MNAWFLLSAALTTAVLVAKPVDERPRFTKAHVIPHGHWRNGPVTRGQFVTIYGDHLKPARWYGKPHTQRAPYPAQLCGVRVTIGSREAGLMYVDRMGGVARCSKMKRLLVPVTSAATGSKFVQNGRPVKTPNLTKVARTGYSDWIQVVVEPYPSEER